MSKSPKYVLFTDHLADYSCKDEYIEIEANEFMDAFKQAAELIKDETMYLVRIYCREKNSKKYNRLCNVRSHNVVEPIDNDVITREVFDGRVSYQ